MATLSERLANKAHYTNTVLPKTFIKPFTISALDIQGWITGIEAALDNIAGEGKYARTIQFYNVDNPTDFHDIVKDNGGDSKFENQMCPLGYYSWVRIQQQYLENRGLSWHVKKKCEAQLVETIEAFLKQLQSSWQEVHPDVPVRVVNCSLEFSWKRRKTDSDD